MSGWERLAHCDLGIFRVMFAIVALLTMPTFTWATAYPDELYTPPPGPMRWWFGGFPSTWVLFAVGAGVALALACLLFSVAVRTASWAATLLLLYGYGVHNSLGKIDHTVLLVLTPVVMALAGWAPGSRVQPWVVQLWAFRIGVAMLTAGLPKILGGWLDPSTSAVHGILAQQVLGYDQHAALSGLALHLTSQWLWEPVDWISPLLEVSVIVVALVGLRAFRAVLALLTGFHLAIALTLNIAFIANVVAYGSFVDWKTVPGAARLADRVDEASRWWVLPVAAVSLAFSYAGVDVGLLVLVLGVGVAVQQTWRLVESRVASRSGHAGDAAQELVRGDVYGSTPPRRG